MNEPLARAGITEPGEPLVSAITPVEAASRLARFCTITGLDEADVVTSSCCTTPAPLYPRRWPDGRRRWQGVKPEAMWHPLLWLPERLAIRAVIVDGDGKPQVEDDDLWLARVCIELLDAGFVRHDGTWVDVLALHGLDVDDPDVQHRLEAWMAGAKDPDLDAIDLAGHLDDQNDPWWALPVASDAVAITGPVVWSLAASSLRATLTEADDLHATARACALMATEALRRMPDQHDWIALVDSCDGTTQDLADRIVPRMVMWLDAVVDRWDPEVAETVDLADRIAPEDDDIAW